MRATRAVFLAVLFAIATVEALADADVSITKSGSPSPVNAGQNLAYTITITNHGPGNAPNIRLIDTIPANTTFVSVTHSRMGYQWGCFYPYQPSTLMCTGIGIPPGENWVVNLTVRVDGGAVGQTVTNNASITITDPDPNPANDSATEVTPVSAVPPTDSDVSVTKVNLPLGRTLIGRGEVMQYGITVRNGGPAAANVTLTDPVPANTTFESIVQDGGPPFNCVTPPVGGTGNVTCTGLAVPDQAQATFTLSVRVNAGASGTVTNTASVASNNPDPDPADNASAPPAVTITNPGADLDLSKSASPPLPAAGDILTYTLTATNIGSTPAANVLIDDAVPANTTFVSASWNGTGGTAAPFCAPPSATPNGHVRCVMNSLPPNVTFSFTINVRVNSDAVGATITNTATIESPTNDPNQANNTATVQTNVSPIAPVNADLSVGKELPSSAQPFAGVGETITYLIQTRNDGPAVAQNFTLSDPLPPHTTFESITQTFGPAFNCAPPPVGTNGTVTCSIAALGSGIQANFTLVVRVAPSAGTSGTISNTATVSSANPDPDPADNSSTRNVTVTRPGPDLQVTKSSTPANATPGQNLVYNITVTNVGSKPAFGTLSDPIPAQTTFVTYTEPPPTGINCFPPIGANQAFSCSMGTFLPGDTGTFTFTVRVNDDATGPAINNTATVTVTSGGTDPDLSNNSVTIQSPLPPTTADLAVTKTTPDPLVARGDTTTFTITLTNNGPLAAQNVTLTDAIPAGTTFESFVQNTGPAFACNTAGTISCTNASFANGATATFTLTVRVAVNAAGTITNTATASAQTPDHDNTNNAGTAATAVGAAADANIPTLDPRVLVLLAIALAVAGFMAVKS